MGATFTWNGGGGNVNWSTAGNWTGGTPTSATTTDLVFAGVTNTGTAGTPLNQNIANPFVLNTITFNAAGGTFFLGGNPLQFNGATDTITQNSSSAESIANVITANGKSGNNTETITLTGNGTGAVTLSGNILVGNGSRDYAITKTGTSTFVLSGNNTYTGATTVNGGTLLVNGSTAVGSAVTVNSGGTLGGTGTVNGTVTTAGTGIIDPGPKGTAGTSGAVGTLHTGALTLASTSTFHADAFGTAAANWDQLVVAGTAALGGAQFSLSIATAGLNFATGATYIVIDASAITGQFSGLTEGAIVSSNGYNFTAHYDTVAGNFDLIAIPEPSTWVAAALTLLAIGYTQRRKVMATLKTLPVSSSKL